MGTQREFDIDTARANVWSGGIETTVVRAVNTNLWAVFFVAKHGEAMLVTTRERKPRFFRDAHLALKALREIGIVSAQIDMEGWSTTAGKVPAWGRADQATSMKLTHARADAEARFERELKAAIEAAPDAQWNENKAIVKAVASKVEDVAAAAAFEATLKVAPSGSGGWSPFDEVEFSIADAVSSSQNAGQL
ncbi:hypothetical protein ACFPTO_11740 [Paraburkholderia denitrificans]|uniref:Uncharacterized protein n=1 Tax=Paraburkholderia denitrificans TaxID=694025 RepID=A0ABW0J8Q6_9BURK